jgi:ketosteroid isomerase-like protein
MGEKENRALAERLIGSWGDPDSPEFDELVADDCVQEWPQSGERIRGKANMRAINKNYPGLPTMNVNRFSTGGNLVVAEVELDYDGKKYNGVTIFEIEGGKVVKETDYFAEPFPAPEWRAQWVEKM